MNQPDTITLISDKNEVSIKISTILYVMMKGNVAYVHSIAAPVIQSRITLVELEEQLGDGFIKVKRGCLVSVMAIYNITDKVNLCNGESLDYAQRNRSAIEEELQRKQRRMIQSFAGSDIPQTDGEYMEYYRAFEMMPFAFTDIEMVFDEQFRAVDWVFRYGNPALEEVEKLPLGTMIGSRFSTLFANMDKKWLHIYERATLFGEMLSIVDYSPEIDRNLEIICFPTFRGHCGCILLDVEQMQFTRKTTDTEKAIAALITKLLS